MHTYTITTPRGFTETIRSASKPDARYGMLTVAARLLAQGSSVKVTCPVNGTWIYNNTGDCLALVQAEIARMDAIGS